MKVVNPLGRQLDTGMGANFEITPYACQCSNWNAYAASRGRGDTCAHCGCQCDGGWYQSLGNNNGASGTNRASR